MRYIVQCEVPAPSLTIQVNIRRVILGQRLKDAHRASLIFTMSLKHECIFLCTKYSFNVILDFQVVFSRKKN